MVVRQAHDAEQGRSAERRPRWTECPWCGGEVPVTVPRRGQCTYLCGTCKQYLGVLSDGTVFRQQDLRDLETKEVVG